MSSSIKLIRCRQTNCCNSILVAAGFCYERHQMVGTPPRRHSSRHRRTASILAQRAIAQISPVRSRDRRRERRRVERNRRLRARAAILRDMRDLFGLPQLRRVQCVVPQPRVDRGPEVIDLAGTSSEESDHQPQEQHNGLVQLDSSADSLPNIDPRPQWQLPVEPLCDLGPLDVTAECQPPLQHQVFREACVLLQRLQAPPLRPITPPPELPPQPQEQDWVEVEAAVARFDGQEYLVVPHLPLLQQPDVAPVPQHIPTGFAAPPPMPEVDWATIAGALFAVVEREHRINYPN